MADAEDDDGGARILARIARALDLPLEAFYDPVARSPGEPETEQGQEAELLRLFREIRDPQERSRCFALIRGMASLPRDRTGDA